MNIIITVTIILILQLISLEYLEVELIDSTNKSQCIDGLKRFKIIYHGPNSCSSSRRLPFLLVSLGVFPETGLSRPATTFKQHVVLCNGV
ncbi:hypothetical protein F2Q69_00028322 [Brassica cretica]|uniref:Secreted protein n=1 Tax=Brassica cretica TaxID=69181 RepID=A0A8S9S2H2_BRACR|nr:hypothetical protein F2Q69_00028322 [Brassica cretica]